MTRPACMTDPEYALWSQANDVLSSAAPSPCFDCPAAFARSMSDQGCCDGTPGVVAHRPRLTDRIITYRGRGSKYPTEQDRLDARRQQWRDYYRRRTA